MAKKKTEFNMSAEVRKLLEANPKLTGREVQERLKKKFPRQKINPSSCGVAYSNSRKKLGISSKTKKKVVRKKRPQSRQTSESVDLDVLRAAKDLLGACGGDADLAVAAVKALRSLQIS